MSVKTKRVFWIAWSVLFVFTMVITFMPFEAHAALTDPMTVNPANVIRVDELPAASESLVGKYYDVNGDVYVCTFEAPDSIPLSVGLELSGGYIVFNYGLTFDSVLEASVSSYLFMVEPVVTPVVALAKVNESNTHFLYFNSTGIAYGQLKSASNITVVSQANYPTAPNMSTSLRIDGSYQIVQLPENNALTQYIRFIPDGGTYDWELVHTHNLVEYTLENPTCTEEGLASIGCIYCEVLDIYDDSYSIPPTGHSYVEVSRKTECLTITVFTSCTGCGYTKTETLQGPGHQYNTSYTPGSSNILGYTIYTCFGCNDTYVIYDEWDCDLNGHGWAEDHRTQRCTDTIVHYYCPNCEVTKQETIAGGLGHDLYESSSSGNCETRSVKYSCRRSGCTYSVTQTEKRNHAYFEIKTEGTCDHAVVTYSCTICGDTYSETSTEAHNWSETSRTDATCTAAGSVTSTCTACGAVNTEVIKAKGHLNTLEQFEDNGYRVKRYTCTVCGNVEEHRTALPQAPDVDLEDVSNFILTFFGSLASFFLYILANVSFLGINGLDLLGILVIVGFVVIIGSITKRGN